MITNNDGKEKKHALFPFSPRANHLWQGEVFWSAGKCEPAIWNQNLSKEEKAELDEELGSITEEVRGGRVVVKNQDVPVREEQTRKPDQNTVMGGSAIDAYKDFENQYKHELSKEMKEKFHKAEKARPNYRGGHPNTQVRPEWLHAKGYSLTPLDEDPQKKSNLGAAPKWVNSKMMIPERTAKWHAINRPNSKSTVDAQFQMLVDSDIIKKGHFEVTVEENDKAVKMVQELYPFHKTPAFPKPTDIGQTVLVTHKILTNQAPASVQEVRTESSKIGSPPEVHKPVCNVSEERGKKLMPTAHQHERSVVQIETTFQTENYEEPWRGTAHNSCGGSGFVIEHNNEYFILTNAHVVENQVYVRVRLANEDKSYTAETVVVGYQCDTALLKVVNPEFLSKVEPVQFGDMVEVKQKVQVVGFPMGGEELSTTEGIISRIQVDSYVESGERLLQAQTDSAINPGNSGGPVFSDGLLVGIAFQGIGLADGLGYLIPIPIVQHFLQDALSEEVYKGFPSLPITYQPMDNDYLHSAFHMEKDQTGVRISQVDDISDACRYLKKDDIILKVDGIKISNDGKAHVPGIGSRIDFNHLFQIKQMGECADITVLRYSSETGPIELTFSVPLTSSAGQTKKIGPIEYDKAPTYLYASGILFQPVTPNYLETTHGLVLREAIIPGVGALTDIPKKNFDDELIIINKILHSDSTRGYDLQENAFVKKINGVEVNNMRAVAHAVDTNNSEVLLIEVEGGDAIAVENMTHQAHMALLNKYRIKFDRSEDLRNQDIVNSNTITLMDVNQSLPIKKRKGSNSLPILNTSNLGSNKLERSDLRQQRISDFLVDITANQQQDEYEPEYGISLGSHDTDVTFNSTEQESNISNLIDDTLVDENDNHEIFNQERPEKKRKTDGLLMYQAALEDIENKYSNKPQENESQRPKRKTRRNTIIESDDDSFPPVTRSSKRRPSL